MATDPGSNNLDEFDIEQVINWDEHNYASKNLEFQQLPDLDLPTDVPVTGQSALPGTSTQASHGAGMMMRTQVLGSHPQPVVGRDQGTSIMNMSQATHTSVLNPVFPQDASCIIADIQQELVNSTSAAQTRRIHVSPTFPSENFDLPPLSHPVHLVTQGAPSMNYIPRHTSQVTTAPQMVHNMTRHPSMHNRMPGFNQSNMPNIPVNQQQSNMTTPMANIPVNQQQSNIQTAIPNIPINQQRSNMRTAMPNMSVNQQLDAGIEEDEGSIDKLIEDIVDRDMPQGLGDPIVFPQSTHTLPLATQHVTQQIQQVMTPRSNSPGQMVSMVCSPSTSQTVPLGSMAGSNPRGGGTPVSGGNPMGNSNPLGGSPLGQKPSSPLMPARVPSPNVSAPQNVKIQQHKGSVSLRTAPKPTMKLLSQQQPASPQNMAMGMAPGQVSSPRSASQRSPQHIVNVLNPTPSPAVITQNIPSPLSQMSPHKMPGTPPTMNTQVQHSPVASPLNIQSSQTSRPSGRASPGVRNLGSPGNQVVSKGKDVAKLQAQAGFPQSSMANMTTQSKVSCKPQQTSQGSPVLVRHATNSQSRVSHTQASVIPSKGGKPMHKLKSTMQAKNAYPNITSKGQASIAASKPAQAMAAIQRQVNMSQSNTTSQMQTSVVTHTLSSTPTRAQPVTLSQAQGGRKTQADITTNIQTPAITSRMSGTPTSTIDTATAQNILKGISALKGANIIPITLRQGANQQLQAVPLSGGAANVNLLKQAMLLKAVAPTSAGQAISLGQPVSISTSQGQVIYYILPKGTNVNSATTLQAVPNGSISINSSGQQVKMFLVNSKNSLNASKPVAPITGITAASTMQSTQVLSSGTTAAEVLSTFPQATVKVEQAAMMPQQVSLSQQNPMLAMSSVIKSIGRNVMSTLPTSTVTNGTMIMSTGQGNGGFSITGQTQQNLLTVQSPSNPLHVGLGGQTASNSAPNVLLVPINNPSNPSTVGSIQSAGTTQITFVNESTAIGHLVSASGVGNSSLGSIATHPQSITTSVDTSKVMMTSQITKSVSVPDNSDDSDTPLALVAESLKKAVGEEKKKKKKKMGEKRKKKEKIAGEPPKPLSAYQMFFKETQAAIRQQNTLAQFGEIAKIVGQMWENLPEDQKKGYYSKHEQAKADYQKALGDFTTQQQESPIPKVRKLDTSSMQGNASKESLPKCYISAVSTAKDPSVAIGGKSEGITMKIPKITVNTGTSVKSESGAKAAKGVTSVGSNKMTASSTASTTQPSKPKKPKLAINPISQRICIRDGCAMPARTTKERGTQYCSNDCIVKHCRVVFNSWVAQRKVEAPVS